MEGLQILLIGAAVLILIVNFFINSSNLFKIITYCFQTNSVDKYWDYFFKSCVSGRAVISSIIGFVLALALFIIIAPIILIRGLLNNKKTKVLLEDGLFFEYQDQELNSKNLQFHSNFTKETGIAIDPITVSGKIRVDAILTLGEIKSKCDELQKNISFEVMHNVKLHDNTTALVPLFLTIDNKKYPTYFIYNETHKQQYSKIRNKFYDANHKQCIYFSTLPM